VSDSAPNVSARDLQGFCQWAVVLETVRIEPWGGGVGRGIQSSLGSTQGDRAFDRDLVWKLQWETSITFWGVGVRVNSSCILTEGGMEKVFVQAW